MKPIVMNKETEMNILKHFIEKFKKEMDNFKFNMNETKFSLSIDLAEKAKEKVKIVYHPQAFLRMQALVQHFDTEVGWYGLVTKEKENVYYVYDVKICKQYVNGGKVDTEDEDTLAFFNSLTDDEAEHMHFQAHSHVKMSTTASGVDMQNQADVVRNMGKSGFYIFQIWNKNNDINTYLYDIDNNIFYDRNDVELLIEDSESTLDEYVKAAEKLVLEKKNYPYVYNDKSNFTKNGKRKKSDESPYLKGYWDGVYPAYERWDY